MELKIYLTDMSYAHLVEKISLSVLNLWNLSQIVRKFVVIVAHAIAKRQDVHSISSHGNGINHCRTRADQYHKYQQQSLLPAHLRKSLSWHCGCSVASMEMWSLRSRQDSFCRSLCWCSFSSFLSACRPRTNRSREI